MKFIYKKEFDKDEYRVYSGYIQEDERNREFRYYKFKNGNNIDYIIIEMDDKKWFDGTDSKEGKNIMGKIDEMEGTKTI